MKFRIVLGMVALLLVLVGCSSKVKRPDSFPAGYIVAEGDRVALALPPEYTAMIPSPDDFRARAEQLRPNNPFLAAHMDKMAQEIQDDTLRLAAYHEDGFTTIAITSERVPTFQSTSSQAAANRKGLEEAGYVVSKVDDVSINGEDAERTQAEIQIQTTGGTMAVTLLQYTFVKGGRAYSISFGTPTVQFAEMKSEFEQIAKTFYTIE